MERTQKSEPIDSAHQSRDVIEQSSTNQQGHLERLFKRRSTALKQLNENSKYNNAYISDLINVQSLLDIREMQSRQRKLHNVSSFEDRIVINVCGDRYETHRRTLDLYPNTLLGNRKRCKFYYDKTRNEYFFDRSRSCFEAILYYYQSHGRLRRPDYVPIDTFLEEVSFFQLGQEALNQIRKDENIKEVKKICLPKNRFRRHLWSTMEYPEYSILAKIINIISLLMILISAIALAVKSLPQYKNIDQLVCYNSTINDLNNTNETKQVSNNNEIICNNYFTSPFFIIQSVCVAFFTLELILRIISTPSFFNFIKNIMNWIDIAAVVPHYVTIGIYLADRNDTINKTTSAGFRLLRILRFLRVLKFYRVCKNVKSIRALEATIRESLPQFFLMIIILTLFGFLFGAAAYFAENNVNSEAFDSIIKATYWGIISITGVGYGDITPITPIGRIIAALCGLCGAAIIGMLVSILVDQYQRVFARKLYINEDIIDFHEFSDDENNDTDSRRSSGQSHRRCNMKETECSDLRTKFNSVFEKDNNHTIPTINISSTPDIEIINEDPRNQYSSGVHFIIGYVDNEKEEKSRDLLETISSFVTQKQIAGDNIRLSIVSDESLDDDNDKNTDDDDDDELAEIVAGCGKRGNVLKKFQRSPSPKNKNQFDGAEKY
ncbi:unnamed protein product [Rotaria sordida]|uniref:BTB domain-containing protein n=1 Tax=Rotaria sordida TaxID=392033 RepID=A0A819NFD2_9BILA|nr:unnamed protein product [Rotaria sordida]CAF3997231.1 unnamed protein product [Rotaria sordida]